MNRAREALRLLLMPNGEKAITYFNTVSSEAAVIDWQAEGRAYHSRSCATLDGDLPRSAAKRTRASVGHRLANFTWWYCLRKDLKSNISKVRL
jgi:hypothetical protein